MKLVDESAPMANGAAEAGPRRRRRWTRTEKQRLVAETLASGASVSRVARRHDVNANLLFTWRRQARRGMLGSAPLIAAGGESVLVVPITGSTREAAPPPRLTAGAGRRTRQL